MDCFGTEIQLRTKCWGKKEKKKRTEDHTKKILLFKVSHFMHMNITMTTFKCQMSNYWYHI